VGEGKVLAQAAEKDTTLTAYFKANEHIPEARNYLYQDFPMHFVWITKGNKQWQLRQWGDAIG
jgi:DNA-directed RNA polymerase delta subunit